MLSADCGLLMADCCRLIFGQEADFRSKTRKPGILPGQLLGGVI